MLSRFIAPIAAILVVVAVGFMSAHRRNSMALAPRYDSSSDKAPSSDTPQASSSADQGSNRGGTVGTTGTDHGDHVMSTDLFRQIAKEENPVVVAITAQSHVPANELPQFFGDDDFFSRFFNGRPQLKDQLRHTLGSGFLINANG